MDDAGLLDRMRRGDDQAFSELFSRYQPAVLRYAAQMCGRPAADDIVQEAFLALLRQLDRYDAARGSVLGYLLGIARHHVLRRLSMLRHEAPLDDTATGGPLTGNHAGNPFDDMSRTEAIERVRAAVQGLPPVFREVVVLCELNELDYSVAASVIGCPIGTVRSRLHRGRALLSDMLTSMRPGALTIDG